MPFVTPSFFSSFEWDLQEVKEHHLKLSREMKAELNLLRTLDPEFVAPPGATPTTR
jgi:hypothetical protein